MNDFTIICNKCKNEIIVEHNDYNSNGITVGPDTCGQLVFINCSICKNEVQIFI
jgi:hypothetical protein